MGEGRELSQSSGLLPGDVGERIAEYAPPGSRPLEARMPDRDLPLPDESDEFQLDDSIVLREDSPAPTPTPVPEPQPLLEDDGDEYELEAPDDSIVDFAKQQAAEDLERANEALEIDQAQKAMEERQMFDGEDIDFKFRFQIKHMLIATTVLSLVMSLTVLLEANLFAVLLVLIFIGLAAAHAFLNYREQKRVEKASQLRMAALRRMREREAGHAPSEDLTMYDEELEPVDEEFEGAVKDERLKLSFSVKDMLIATTVAAVVMGIGALMPPPVLAVLLGLVAVTGLAAYGLGAQPPKEVITVWWMTLAMYVLLCLGRATGVVGGG